MITAICSGGQTGADQGGLLAGEAMNIFTFGWAPKGFKTEAGPAPWLEDRFNVMEHPSDSYEDRTRANVLASDGTIIIGRRSRGSNRTEEECRLAKKPCMWVAWPDKMVKSKDGYAFIFNPTELNNPYMFILQWSIGQKVSILNVAGNRESKNPGIAEYTVNLLLRTFKR